MKRKSIWLLYKIIRHFNKKQTTYKPPAKPYVKTTDEYKGLDWFQRQRLFWEERLNIYEK